MDNNEFQQWNQSPQNFMANQYPAPVPQQMQQWMNQNYAYMMFYRQCQQQQQQYRYQQQQQQQQQQSQQQQPFQNNHQQLQQQSFQQFLQQQQHQPQQQQNQLPLSQVAQFTQNLNLFQKQSPQNAFYQQDYPDMKQNFLMPKTKESLQQQENHQKQDYTKMIVLEPVLDEPKLEVQLQFIDQNEIKKNLSQFVQINTCHFCKGSNRICYYCYENYKTTNCKVGYCFDCLSFRFKQNMMKTLTLQSSWKCPFEDNFCSCSQCQNIVDASAGSSPYSINSASSSKYSRMIDNLQKIKKRFYKRKIIIKDLFQTKFQHLDTRVKRKQIMFQVSKQRHQNKARVKRQLQFTGELILRLKRATIKQDEQIMHNVIQFNLKQLKSSYEDQGV